MTFEIEGKVVKAGVTKTGKNYINILVQRPDGFADSVMVFTKDGGQKANATFKGKVNAFVTMCTEL